MRDFERRRHLLDFNPWWQDPRRWQDRDPDLREARLNALSAYDPHPLSDIVLGSLYLLMGRQIRQERQSLRQDSRDIRIRETYPPLAMAQSIVR